VGPAQQAERWMPRPIRSGQPKPEDVLMSIGRDDKNTSGTSSALKRFVNWLHGPMPPGPAHLAHAPLILCEACRSATANPVDWCVADDARWWIRLRCGDCGWSREVIVPDAVAHRLERDLEPGLRAIAAAADQLDRERMTEEVARFLTGLEHDLIGPDDFARYFPRK
jgi:hypothetical protein